MLDRGRKDEVRSPGSHGAPRGLGSPWRERSQLMP